VRRHGNLAPALVRVTPATGGGVSPLAAWVHVRLARKPAERVFWAQWAVGAFNLIYFGNMNYK
jgi:hypothetical protein